MKSLFRQTPAQARIEHLLGFKSPQAKKVYRRQKAQLDCIDYGLAVFIITISVIGMLYTAYYGFKNSRSVGLSVLVVVIAVCIIAIVLAHVWRAENRSNF